MTEAVEAAHATVEARVAALTDAGVRFVRVLYPDLHGIPRGKEIPIGELVEVVENGVFFVEAIMTVDLRHNVVAGFEHGFQDIVARPDLGTLVQAPWEPAVAWCLADLERSVTREPYGPDPRGALRRAMASWAEMGYTPIIGPELEFYLCRPDPSAPCGFRPYDEKHSHVYTAGRLADPQGLMSELLAASLDFGIRACAANHEYGRSQFEINIKHGEALGSADRAFRFKALVKELAARAGLMATFMGKPWNDDEGSGFHLHLSLVDETGDNVLLADEDEAGLSPLTLQFIAGVLAHAPALMAFFNPTVNAYRRLHPEALVPTRTNWGLDNRFTFVRVPPERGPATRIEIRVGDGAANPYLAYAAALNAGLDGVRRGLEPPAPVTGNIYELPEEDQGEVLPASFPEALDALEADETIRAAVGDELVSTFLEIKRYEVGRYRRYVTDWDFAEYAHHL